MKPNAFPIVAAVAACALILVVVPIWLALKAEPVGDKPYRWGTYAGIGHGLLFVLMILAAFRTTDPNLPPIAVACISMIVGSPLALVSIGLLSRRRYGVIAFFVVQTFFWLVGMAEVSQDADKVILRFVFGFAYLAATAAYFRRRWGCMGASSPGAESKIRDIGQSGAEAGVEAIKTAPADNS